MSNVVVVGSLMLVGGSGNCIVCVRCKYACATPARVFAFAPQVWGLLRLPEEGRSLQRLLARIQAELDTYSDAHLARIGQ